MPRLITVLAVLALVATACTASETTQPTTMNSDVTTSTTSGPPLSTTTSGPSGQPSPDPELPNPVDIAEQGWGELSGFTQTDLNDSEIDAVDFRLATFMGRAIEGVSYTGLQPEDGGPSVIGLSMMPAPVLQGDPFLAPRLAEALAGQFDSLEAIELGDVTAYRIFLGESWWYLWASNSHLYATIGSESEAEQALAATIAGAPDPYLWQAGDCLWFGTGEEASLPYAPYNNAYLVTCTGPHSHEVIFSSVTSYGSADGYPGDRFSTEVNRSCDIAFRDYVGTSWTDSKVSVTRYLPDLAEWEEGDRYTVCVVEMTDSTGGTARIDGTLRGIGEAALISRTAGDCLIGSFNVDAVDCRLAHTAQFIGFLEDPAPEHAEFPRPPDLIETETSICSELIEQFSPVVEKDGVRVAPHVIPPSIVDWENGIRTFRCFAFALDDDGQQVEVSGSFDSDWEIIRFAEDDVTACRQSRQVRVPPELGTNT